MLDHTFLKTNSYVAVPTSKQTSKYPLTSMVKREKNVYSNDNDYTPGTKYIGGI